MQERRCKSKEDSILLVIAGLILMMDSLFTTNLSRDPPSMHGTIHGFGGFFFFVRAPIDSLLVSPKRNLAQFLVTLVASMIGFVTLAVPIDVGGLAKRILLLVIFSSVIPNSSHL